MKTLFRKLLVKLGIKKPPDPGGRPRAKLYYFEIDELKKSGKSNRQIAKLLNVSEKTIRNRLKDE